MVGLEDYQPRSSGALSKVDYARQDAEGFAEALQIIYREDQLNLTLLVDNFATRGNLDYELHQAIQSLTTDDLFVLYYAGHGFHGPGGNRITAWDTHAYNIEDTTILLRDALIDRLAKSGCSRAMAFVDACGTDFASIVPGRDVVSSMDPAELKSFLTSAKYFALFMSCGPGEKSYPSAEFKHGIWTYFLLKALRGDADSALGPGRYLTDSGLRDYLRHEVPRYITQRTTHRARQTPQAMITASNTFAIREVPLPVVAMATAGDLRRIRVVPTTEFLEGTEGGRIRSLPGFSKSRGHFEPDVINERTRAFVCGLLADDVDEQIQSLYEAIKENFGLRRRDIARLSGAGQGSVDTNFFRFSIETGQDPTDPKSYLIVRRLVIRGDPGAHLSEIDQTFGTMFERVAVEVNPGTLNYDELADLFEDVEAALGGKLRDEQHVRRLTYTAPDGTSIRIDLEHDQISLSCGRRQLFSDLLARARQYRFELSGPSHLFLS